MNKGRAFYGRLACATCNDALGFGETGSLRGTAQAVGGGLDAVLERAGAGGAFEVSQLGRRQITIHDDHVRAVAWTRTRLDRVLSVIFICVVHRRR